MRPFEEEIVMGADVPAPVGKVFLEECVRCGEKAVRVTEFKPPHGPAASVVEPFYEAECARCGFGKVTSHSRGSCLARFYGNMLEEKHKTVGRSKIVGRNRGG